MEQKPKEGELPVLFLLKTLLLAYILTGALLAVLAFLLYKTGIGEKAVTVGIIVIYVASTFFAGFVAGKKLKARKFLWGLILGLAYFLILTALSLSAGQEALQAGNSFLTTLVLCAGGGMLGGMLS